MHKLLTLVLLTVSSVLSAAISDTVPNYNIIPRPNTILSNDFRSSIDALNIYIDNSYYTPYLKKLFEGIDNVKWTKKEDANVVFEPIESLDHESYTLSIGSDKVSIKANGSTGLQYGLTTLAQIVQNDGWPLPVLLISDSPKYEYRGMHLDVVRHFFSVDEVKKYLDFMAYYKFNKFHWHLTDDQGWRIEIKKYPKLQEVAAYRKETLIGHYNDVPQKYDGKRYGGYYTQDQIKEIVQYAADRHITVIPEIELPGHVKAALAAYPELGCEDKKYETATTWGVFEDVLCPNAFTFEFLEGVMDEVIQLFPGKYIHVGGDECPRDAWKRSAFCQEFMRRHNIENEAGIQSYFIQRIEQYINSKGKQIIGWDEILEGGLADNATVMSWRGTEGGIQAARMDHNVIMTPGSHCYFDYYQSESPDEPIAIGGYIPLEKVYKWDPTPTELEDNKKRFILGGQANLWTEYIATFSHLEYMAYARAMAMSEALWSKSKDYLQFLDRFEKHNDFWRVKGVNIAFHAYDLKPVVQAGDGLPIRLSFEVPYGTKVAYQFNDGKVKPFSKDGPMIISQSGKYIFSAGKGDRHGNPLKINFNLHKGTKAKLKLRDMPSVKYAGNGPGSLVNGVLGSDNKYGGTEWLGFEGKDCEGLLGWDDIEKIKYVTFRFFNGIGQWIYLPKAVEVSYSKDGLNYKTIQYKGDIETSSKVATIKVPVKAKAKYLKFKITNYGEIPSGAQGAGYRAWLFVDEIVVE
ncbi:MAG: beta-N-acetylhexosaminidase [Saprospiraceae bacterium]|nr:MAG: glycoside hydrolase [Bacteroidetes bacterium OLB9]MCO6463126.1 beta-N-acetylhexosaminidase [Saprospiraceae bacterium]MCZ2337887.1 family 20 glycosylhydrolase [Chitinophagales bacterium]